ncbi:DNA cytosine methyltransferase [Selenomonas ruminantium]|uniref:DNA cytosine methyltransferase n=1 Tax=Selenomonas ruminantium TaxID=971 RepID=UPI00055FAE96|nr:DNA cytosine methyltransferase [Selenomonas ruminantium]
MGRKRANHSLLGRNLMDYFKCENVNLLYQLRSDCLPPIPKRGVTDKLAAEILGYNRPDYIALISMRDRKDVTFSTVEAFAQRLRVPLPVLFVRSCQTIIYGYYQEILRDGNLPQTFKAEAYLKNFATNIKRTLKENRWEIQRLYSISLWENRTFSVREMARCQSFDDSFEFLGKRTTGGLLRRVEVPQHTQVGNAVPPLLARAVAMEIVKVLEAAKPQEETSDSKCTYPELNVDRNNVCLVMDKKKVTA